LEIKHCRTCSIGRVCRHAGYLPVCTCVSGFRLPGSRCISLNGGGPSARQPALRYHADRAAKTLLLPSFQQRRRHPIQHGQISSTGVSYAASPQGNSGGLYLFLPGGLSIPLTHEKPPSRVSCDGPRRGTDGPYGPVDGRPTLWWSGKRDRARPRRRPSRTRVERIWSGSFVAPWQWRQGQRGLPTRTCADLKNPRRFYHHVARIASFIAVVRFCDVE
jgi:hypothetical protein